MTYDVQTPSAARLWRYEPDFSSGYEIRRAFLTDIITSRSNKEQRRALRDVARVSASYSTVLTDANLQAAKHFLRVWQNKPTAVPDFSRWTATTGASASGTNTLTIASPPAWAVAGSLALLCGSDGTRELVEIGSVSAPTINLVSALDNTWPSGSILRPCLFGLLDGRLTAQRLTRGTHRISVLAAAYPGAEPVEDEGTATDTFNGYEVFTAEPNFAAYPSLDYLFPVEQIDYGIGRTAQFRPVEQLEQMIECEFSGLSPAAALAIEQVFLRAKGMRGAFYRPSCEKDMTLAANASASLTIDVEGTSLADDFAQFDAPYEDTAIEIVKTDGTRLRRLISSVAVNGDNSRITVDALTTAAVADVARISWMPLVRFASDELATRWVSPLSASIRASFQTVKS